MWILPLQTPTNGCWDHWEQDCFLCGANILRGCNRVWSVREAPIARDLALRLGKLWPELEILATVNNGLEAVEQIDELRPDIAFLDINMPGLTGLQVARQLQASPYIVFVTAYSEHAVEAFERLTYSGRVTFFAMTDTAPRGASE